MELTEFISKWLDMSDNDLCNILNGVCQAEEGETVHRVLCRLKTPQDGKVRTRFFIQILPHDFPPGAPSKRPRYLRVCITDDDGNIIADEFVRDEFPRTARSKKGGQK